MGEDKDTIPDKWLEKYFSYLGAGTKGEEAMWAGVIWQNLILEGESDDPGIRRN